jgi:hypothetical protein
MPGLFMLSIQVKSESCPTQMTPGPRSPGAATVTDTGVVSGVGHNSKLFNIIFAVNITKNELAVKQEIFVV